MKRTLKTSEEYKRAARGEGEYLVHHIKGKWAYLILKAL